MAEVVTIVRGVIAAERESEVIGRYREGVKEGPPPDIEETLRRIAAGIRIPLRLVEA